MTSADGGSGGGDFTFFIFLGVFFVIIYFFMIRPQSKKAKEQKNLLSNLKKGDRVVTIGGIHAKILTVNEDSYLLEIDSNTKVKVDKTSISLDFTKKMLERTGNNKQG